MPFTASIAQWVLGTLLIFSSIGVLLFEKPVHASLSFLLTLLSLAALYLQLHAEFIGIMQILVYAGAILVIFMFVVVLFQDAHAQISLYRAQSFPPLLIGATLAFILAFAALAMRLKSLTPESSVAPKGFGTVESIGPLLYVDFFFPFEAVVIIFLVAVIGALYIGKKEN